MVKTKPILLGILATSLACLPALAQDKKPDEEPNPIKEVADAFSNLPKETREQFGRDLIKAQNLFNQKRIFDALEKLDELDKIFDRYPAAMNIRGACYVEIRNFKKANEVFSKILEIAPKNTNVQFNLAEVEFVTKNWAKAFDRFSKLVPQLPTKTKRDKSMVRLCEFKLLLCMLKTDRLKDAKALRDKYDAWDDSPFFYYSRSAILYHEGKKIEAEKMLRNCRFVWRQDAALAAWQDTLIEFGYIKSFYGGDSDEPAAPVTPTP